jgi:hypothetical protein
MGLALQTQSLCPPWSKLVEAEGASAVELACCSPCLAITSPTKGNSRALLQPLLAVAEAGKHIRLCQHVTPRFPS